VRLEERHQVARRREEEPDGDDPDQQVERVGGDPAPEVRAEHDPHHAQHHARREEAPEGAEDRVVVAQLQVGRRELAKEIRVRGREQARCSLAQPGGANADRVTRAVVTSSRSRRRADAGGSCMMRRGRSSPLTARGCARITREYCRF
jgi:hypothetical protein